MGDQKNLFLAILASLAILLGFQFLFPSEDKTSNIQELEQQDSIKPVPNQEKTVPIARNEIINKTSRINIKNQFLSGSLALTGARIDDIILENCPFCSIWNSSKLKTIDVTELSALFILKLLEVYAPNKDIIKLL